MDIDLNEAKYVKISLITVKGRDNLMINELCRETLVSFVTLKVQDFLQDNVELLHSLPLQQQVYNPKSNIKEANVDISLNCAILVKTVNGATETVEMEGNQLLVGRYALYKDKVIVRVLKVNRNTCSIEAIDE